MCILLNSVPSTGKHLTNVKLKVLGWSAGNPTGHGKVFRPGGSYGSMCYALWVPGSPQVTRGVGGTTTAASPGCPEHPGKGVLDCPRHPSGGELSLGLLLSQDLVVPALALGKAAPAYWF